MKLRSYQEEIVKETRINLINKINKIVVQLATGGGKTVIFSYIVKGSSLKNNKALILTNRIELLEQAGGTFEDFGISYDNLTAQTKKVPNSLVTVSMVETLNNRLKNRLDFQMWFKTISLIIIDECHIAAFDKIFDFIEQEQTVLGFTATPHRKGKMKPLKDFFSSMVHGISISNLINDGYLAKPVYYGVPVDLTTVKMKMGEFDEKSMTALYNENAVFTGLKTNIEKHAKGKKTIIFCPSIETSQKVANDLGCFCVHSKMSKIERDEIIKTFKESKVSILANCGILTTGFDCPDIECVILYRATTSLPLFLQMVGRGSRTTGTKKTFTILDFGKNIQRHGFWHDERQWTLQPQNKKNRNKEDAYPIKECDNCGALVSVNVKKCPECGYVFPVKEKEHIEIELQKLSYDQVKEKAKNATVKELELLRMQQGYKIGWVLHKLETEEDFKEYEQIKGYKKGWAKINYEKRNKQN